jgi:hypothetical protein
MFLEGEDMQTIRKIIGQLMCRIGFHHYVKEGQGVHSIHRCSRCEDTYMEYWGGSRIPIHKK